jgi:hypothetical protein
MNATVIVWEASPPCSTQGCPELAHWRDGYCAACAGKRAARKVIEEMWPRGLSGKESSRG